MTDSKQQFLTKDVHFKRLSWRSRRGLLELDLLLPPYLAACYKDLPVSQQEAYETLLTCEDPDILSWLNQHSVPDDPQIRGIVERIRVWNETH
ncbi:MAG: succinate dehydrogenase assembly factor 2 [Pseudomonadales bacterium]|nr:succinate dehydrogenase assembly factor 2 [Pseudomonadales bacterium]